jgi:SAM-dependent methyltransferase
MTTSEDRQAHWQQVWTGQPPDRLGWFQPSPDMSLRLITAAGLRRDAGVIDVGGGASELADRLVERGWVHVAVLDVAEAAITIAAERMGVLAEEVTWIVADVLQWRPVPGLFELWHDRACFHFLTDEDDRRKYASVMATALVPGGVALIATFAPEGPERCSGLPVQRHDRASLTDALGPDFELVEELAEQHVTPAGDVQPFRWWVLRRR